MVELDTIRASDAPGPGSSPGGHTKIKSRHFLGIENVDFSLCKKYVIMIKTRSKINELYKTSQRIL